MQGFAQNILLLSGLKRALVALLAGALMALALAPFHLFFVGFIAFPILVWLLDGAVGHVESGWIRRHGAAFIVGWSFGFGYFVAGLWWIANALLVEAPEFAWAVPLAILGLPAVLAFFYGFAAFAARLLWSEGVARIVVLAAMFGVFEWLRTFLFTGFPWNAIGNTIQPAPIMMQTSSLLGGSAMDILAVLIFALPAAFLGQTKRSLVVGTVFICLLTAHIGYGAFRLFMVPDPEDEGRVVRLVQPAVDQSKKWNPEEARAIFDELLALTSAASVDEEIAKPQLIIWPETAIPFILTREPAAVAAIAETLTLGQSLLAGVVREEAESEENGAGARYYNAMVLINDEGIINGAADKVHLVPFGEYLPFSEQLKALGFSAVAAADRGYVGASQRRSLTLPGGLGAIPLICYEIIFSNEIKRLSDNDGVMINISNDAWYGNTPGPYQHLHQSQLRAAEMGMPVIRGTNNGISAFIDAKGRLVSTLGYAERGAIDAVLTGSFEATFGKIYGQTIFWLVVLLNATLGIIMRIKH